jgi:hypothetical protein
VTPELTTLAETSETASSNSSAAGGPIKVAPMPAACNGPKKLGGWGRLKAKTASEDRDQPATVTNSSSSSSPSPVVPAVGEPPRESAAARLVSEISLRDEKKDGNVVAGFESAAGAAVVAAAPPPTVVVVPVSDEAASPAAVVPESVVVAGAVAATTRVSGNSTKSGPGLVDPSEMLASLQQFKVRQL